MQHGRGWLALVSLTLVLSGIGSRAEAWEEQYGKGDPTQPTGDATWLAGVSKVASRADRARGHWINGNSWFEYEGDAADFNTFLTDYAKVPHATLYLETLASKGLRPNMSLGYDWDMSIIGCGQVGMPRQIVGTTFYVDGRISLKALRVPLTINLEAADANNPIIARFVAAHRARQAKAKHGKVI